MAPIGGVWGDSMAHSESAAPASSHSSTALLSSAPTPAINPTFSGNGAIERGYNPPGVRHTDSAVALHPVDPVTHDYNSDGPAPGRLGFRWIHGSLVAARNTDPRIQVVQYNEDTFVMRQNVCVHWEAPFTYLLFGNNGALLIDCGATANAAHYPLRESVDAIIARWCDARGRERLPLTIVHTSGEDSAQNQGLVQFADRPQTTIVPLPLGAMKQHFGWQTSWPAGSAVIDLGGRVIEVLPTPGAHRDGLSFYDPYCDLLFTGDLLFPGRINISNDRDFISSLERLQTFTRAHRVAAILGGHIDMMFVPGKSYARFITYKPYERILQMTTDVIADALQSARQIAGRDMMLIRPDFILLNGVSPDQGTDVWPEGVPNINAPYPF